jgi:hypothetical protein
LASKTYSTPAGQSQTPVTADPADGKGPRKNIAKRYEEAKALEKKKKKEKEIKKEQP